VSAHALPSEPTRPIGPVSVNRRHRTAPPQPRSGFYGKALQLPRARLVAGRAAGLAATAFGAIYLFWRLSTIHGLGAIGISFYVAEVLNFGSLVLTAALVWRVRRREQPLPPRGTLDVFVTVCGEPVEMVEATLRAALGIRYKHETYLLNDGHVAGAENSAAIEALAARYGVKCFTRPSGARTKAANLNYALARTSGSLVAVIDADHLASPDFAHETLGHFAPSNVGFVATPQQFSGDRRDPLGNREMLFYRAIQPAKDAADSAFSCGNAAVYRRSALESIGGFSEWNLVEDLHTSYELHAHGWKSVYHPVAVTIGTAPQTVSGLASQRLRWATDSVRIFLWDNPLFKRGLKPIQRLHYLQTTGFYLIAAAQVMFILGPPLWLLLHIPTMRFASSDDYLVHSLPYYASIACFLVAYGGVRGALRVAQQQLYLAPIYALAILRAATYVRGRAGVTDKVSRPRPSLLVVLPLVFLVIECAGLVAALSRPSHALIAAVWAGGIVVALGSLAFALTPRVIVPRVFKVTVRAAAVATVLVLLAGFGSADARRQVRRLAPPATGAYLGVSSPGLLDGPGSVSSWEAGHGAQVRIVNLFQQWLSGERRFRTDWLRTIASQGAVPLITWEPWAKPAGRLWNSNQPDVRLAAIASGRYDSYVRRWARAAAAYGDPILLRPMHEMNGYWYPWSIRANGNTPGDFIAAWRHLHDIFAEEGATNVSWVWTVYASEHGRLKNVDSYYPGARYVDWVSMTGFNWGESRAGSHWRSFDQVFGATYATLTRLGKALMISEIGTVGGSAASSLWLENASRRLQSAYPKIRAVLWFDSRYSRTADFRLDGVRAATFHGSFGAATSYWAPPVRLVTTAARRQTPRPAEPSPASPAPSAG
jgi:cellulose synthase (UDP-forming)